MPIYDVDYHEKQMIAARYKRMKGVSRVQVYTTKEMPNPDTQL